MKKLLIILALIVLIISITACGNTVTTTEPAASTTATVCPENPGDDGSYGVDDPSYPHETFEEYTEFLKTTDLPDDFISYEKISFLGEYICFTHNDDGFKRYDYALKNGEQVLFFSVSPVEDFKDPIHPEYIRPASSLNPDLMENFDKFFQVKIGSAWYTFGNGVRYIQFVNDDHMYVFDFNNKIAPVEEGSIVDRLLHLDTAEEAIEEIKALLAVSKE